MIEESLVTYLKTQSGVTGLIGTGSAMRFYPRNTKSNPTVPYAVYGKISAIREHDLDGSRGSSKSRYQIDCIGGAYSQAKLLAEEIRKSLDGYTTQEFLSAKLENEVDGFDDDTEYQRVTQDYIIYHTEDI